MFNDFDINCIATDEETKGHVSIVIVLGSVVLIFVILIFYFCFVCLRLVSCVLCSRVSGLFIYYYPFGFL